ncbi:hypothetical protein C1149_18545 [Clostridium botulinum]|nr:hypothetical protein C1149_18545 [Clostridium botulinum]
MLNVINLCLVDLHQYLKHKNVEIYPISLAKSPHFVVRVTLPPYLHPTLVKPHLLMVRFSVSVVSEVFLSKY